MKKSKYLLFMVALILNKSYASEPVLSLVEPRIPSEERCKLAKVYIDETLLPVEKNLANYKIFGNCALKANDTKMAKYFWSKAALLGHESSLINIGIISILDPSESERNFGIEVLKKVGQQNVKEKSMLKLFGALMLMSFHHKGLPDDVQEELQTTASLLVEAVELEKPHDIYLSAMVVKYLVEINYFEKAAKTDPVVEQIFIIAKETNFYYCYMFEILKRDLYKLPQVEEVTQRYEDACSIESESQTKAMEELLR